MSLIHALSRLSLSRGLLGFDRVFRQSALSLHTTSILNAEPMKKKKKLDPQIVKQREDRRRKKLEKQIRRLERNARQLKPIEELEVPLDLIDQKEKRKRDLPPLTDVEIERRYQLQKRWTCYKNEQRLADFQIMDRLVQAQFKALEELRMESEELYQEAIQPDISLLPFKAKGPVSTPPIENYDSPDGDYIVEVKKWD